MIEKVKNLVLGLCRGELAWKWNAHVNDVVKNSKLLAKKVNADKEIVEISAWLHDIKKIQGDRKDHHIKGAAEAVKILKEMGYPEEKIKKVEHCIKTHSSDENHMPESIEAKVVASADAMSHFGSFLLFAKIMFSEDNKSVEEAKEWLRRKYAKSWKKMIPEARELAKEKYDAIKIILG